MGILPEGLVREAAEISVREMDVVYRSREPSNHKLSLRLLRPGQSLSPLKIIYTCIKGHV